jgi:hypothetical protein
MRDKGEPYEASGLEAQVAQPWKPARLVEERLYRVQIASVDGHSRIRLVVVFTDRAISKGEVG